MRLPAAGAPPQPVDLTVRGEGFAPTRSLSCIFRVVERADAAGDGEAVAAAEGAAAEEAEVRVPATFVSTTEVHCALPAPTAPTAHVLAVRVEREARGPSTEAPTARGRFVWHSGAAPAVAAVAPAAAPLSGDAPPLVLNGSGFAPAADLECRFAAADGGDAAVAPATFVSLGAARCVAPRWARPATVQLGAAAGGAAGGATVAFTFYNAAAPAVVSAVVPPIAPAGELSVVQIVGLQLPARPHLGAIRRVERRRRRTPPRHLHRFFARTLRGARSGDNAHDASIARRRARGAIRAGRRRLYELRCARGLRGVARLFRRARGSGSGGGDRERLLCARRRAAALSVGRPSAGGGEPRRSVAAALRVAGGQRHGVRAPARRERRRRRALRRRARAAADGAHGRLGLCRRRCAAGALGRRARVRRRRRRRVDHDRRRQLCSDRRAGVRLRRHPRAGERRLAHAGRLCRAARRRRRARHRRPAREPRRRPLVVSGALELLRQPPARGPRRRRP